MAAAVTLRSPQILVACLVGLVLVFLASNRFFGTATLPGLSAEEAGILGQIRAGDAGVSFATANGIPGIIGAVEYGKLDQGRDIAALKEKIFNETLGYHKVIAVSLKDRTDKRDALTLMGSLTGVKIDFIDGVRGSDIPDKAVPFGWHREPGNENNLGSWRGHMNALQHIISENLGSALIMEDDMDWDVNIKSQLLHYAVGAHAIQSTYASHPDPSRDPLDSPYGDKWDLKHLGSCVELPSELLPDFLAADAAPADPRKVLILNDPTVPSFNHILANNSFLWEAYPPSTRVVAVPGDYVCSFVYAVSRSGAQKLLQLLSVGGPLTKPFDNHLSDMCRQRPLGMRCLGVMPSLFVHHRPRGLISGDSDIGAGGGDAVREQGFTENIMYSTRLNLENLIMGREPTKQWLD